MDKTLVMKFGGTSVGSADALTRAVEIIRDATRDWARVVVVTSAMSGVTDLLLSSANPSEASVGADSCQPLRDAENKLRENISPRLIHSSKMKHSASKQRPRSIL